MTAARKKPARDGDAPWDRDNPKAAAGQPHHHLSAPERASAKRHARAAGRPYPNLIDNMRAAAHTDHPAKKRKT